MTTSSQSPPKDLTVCEAYARYAPVAELSLNQTIDLIDDAIRYCRENEVPGLLVDITRVTGFPSPSITDRFWFIRKWAETAGGKVVLAMVAPSHMVMPDKIGITFALNRGLRSDVFTDADEALRWLRIQCE